MFFFFTLSILFLASYDTYVHSFTEQHWKELTDLFIVKVSINYLSNLLGKTLMTFLMLEKSYV